MNQPYLTTDELSAIIKYDSRTIRERLKDSVLIEGIHYFRPFGGRKILFIWKTIERDMMLESDPLAIPMAHTDTTATNEMPPETDTKPVGGPSPVAEIPQSERQSEESGQTKTRSGVSSPVSGRNQPRRRACKNDDLIIPMANGDICTVSATTQPRGNAASLGGAQHV
jgi:hypothetical protein